MNFEVVRCPRCDSVVMEIATGMARGKCPERRCGKRVWAMSNGKEVRIGMVDTPVPRLVASA